MKILKIKKLLFNCYALLFCIILIIAAILRLYALDSLPASLSPDEASLGYTSYSFLLTGADEHGKYLPLSLKSFGDWKLPVYSYIGVIPVAIIGLSEISTRLPSVIAGLIGVVIIYFISLSLFKKKSIALLSALFYALSPWNVYFSRAAYEVNVATTIFLAGLLMLVRLFFDKERNNNYLILAIILFGITMFTYHSYMFISPLFLVVSIIIFRLNFKIDRKFLIAAAFFCLFLSVSYIGIVIGGSNKVSTLMISNDKNVLYNRVEKLRGDNAVKNQYLEKIIHNKYLGVSYQFIQNYINSFSPTFLFDTGGEKLIHNIGGFGYLYVFDVLLVFIGFTALFFNKEKGLLILLPWLFIGPIASAVTRDAPNATRLFVMMPLFIIISAYGANQIIIYTRKSKIKTIILSLLIPLYVFNVIYFLDVYFIHFNYQRIRFWHFGYREAVLLSQKYPTYNVVMRGPENFPYIYFLFYNKYDPLRFRKEAVYYPPTNEGFLFVKQFGKYTFVDNIDYNSLKHNTIYIDTNGTENAEHTINLQSGDAVLGYKINK